MYFIKMSLSLIYYYKIYLTPIVSEILGLINLIYICFDESEFKSKLF